MDRYEVHNNKRAPALALARASDHFWRAAAIKVLTYLGGDPDQIARERYPGDDLSLLIAKGATTQAVTTVPAWAGVLATTAVSEAVQETVSMSALNQVIGAGALKINLDRRYSVTVPGRHTSPADAGQWVVEGAPIPVRQSSVLGPKLSAHKLAVIVSFSRELAESSNIEDVLKALIIEATGPALDLAVFSTAAASPARSAGILHGLTALTPATGTAFDAVGVDLGTLVGDIATRNGGANAVFVAAPPQAISARFYSVGGIGAFASVALPAGTVVAIEPSSLAVTLGNPEFELTNAATLHMEDTNPTDIVHGASTLATPVKSLWQTDLLALKMTLYGDWAMRAPHVAYMDAVIW